MDKRTQELANALLFLGLSNNQARVYMALLEYGRGTVSQISRRANINRTTGYDILDGLVSKGLARISGKEPKQEYAAEDPNSIIALLTSQLEISRANIAALEKNIATAKALAPKLKAVQKSEDRPQVRFYEGIEGLKQVYEDTLTSTEEIVAYASVDDMHATLPNYFPEYYFRRAGKGIHIRGILPKTPLSVERMKHNTKEERTGALVPADEFGFHPEIDIYDNKVMIASWRDKLGIIIESAEIADAMKKIFKLAWIGAKYVGEVPNLGGKTESAVS